MLPLSPKIRLHKPIMFTLHLIKQAQKEILKMPATLRESTFESLKQLELQGNQLKEQLHAK
ncbi:MULTISPECIES: hypothetical protein [unclassified Lonepinella]|uniref:hypothetical protein n=1 Tax=unclassified Lonepinella TaxID=2642006 RepID=UPI0036D8D11F